MSLFAHLCFTLTFASVRYRCYFTPTSPLFHLYFTLMSLLFYAYFTLHHCYFSATPMPSALVCRCLLTSVSLLPFASACYRCYFTFTSPLFHFYFTSIALLLYVYLTATSICIVATSLLHPGLVHLSDAVCSLLFQCHLVSTSLPLHFRITATSLLQHCCSMRPVKWKWWSSDVEVKPLWSCRRCVHFYFTFTSTSLLLQFQLIHTVCHVELNRLSRLSCDIFMHCMSTSILLRCYAASTSCLLQSYFTSTSPMRKHRVELKLSWFTRKSLNSWVIPIL